MIYVLNSIIIPIDFSKYTRARVTLKKVTLEEARSIVTAHSFTSAVGHEGTAQLLSNLLGVTIPVNRVSVYLEAGDQALHFVLKTRLPEGKVLSLEELQQLQYTLVLSTVESTEA